MDFLHLCVSIFVHCQWWPLLMIYLRKNKNKYDKYDKWLEKKLACAEKCKFSLQPQSKHKKHHLNCGKWKISKFFSKPWSCERDLLHVVVFSPQEWWTLLFAVFWLPLVLCFIVRGVLCTGSTEQPVKVMRYFRQISQAPCPVELWDVWCGKSWP